MPHENDSTISFHLNCFIEFSLSLSERLRHERCLNRKILAIITSFFLFQLEKRNKNKFSALLGIRWIITIFVFNVNTFVTTELSIGWNSQSGKQKSKKKRNAINEIKKTDDNFEIISSFIFSYSPAATSFIVRQFVLQMTFTWAIERDQKQYSCTGNSLSIARKRQQFVSRCKFCFFFYWENSISEWRMPPHGYCMRNMTGSFATT